MNQTCYTIQKLKFQDWLYHHCHELIEFRGDEDEDDDEDDEDEEEDEEEIPDDELYDLLFICNRCLHLLYLLSSSISEGEPYGEGDICILLLGLWYLLLLGWKKSSDIEILGGL